MNVTDRNIAGDALSGSFTADFFAKGGMFYIIGASLLLTLQFQTLPFKIEAQVLPLTSLLALMFFPFALFNMRKSPLLYVVMIFGIYVIAHSVIGLFIDIFDKKADVRLYSWARQILALIAGLATFLLFRTALRYISDRKIVYFIIVGSIPALMLGILNILWGALRQQWAGNIVMGIRSFVAPLGYTASLRASGLSMEPSTFAATLVVLVIPMLFVVFSFSKSKLFAWAIILLTLASFSWTFSLSGLFLLLCLFLLGLFFGPKRPLILSFGIIFLTSFLFVIYLLPSNQSLKHIRSLALGQSNISWMDRYYSTVGPFMTSFSSYTMIGYGLGGTVNHFSEMLPPSVEKDIAAVKWKELPNLSTLTGRIFAETGAIGFGFFLTIFGVATWQYRRMHRAINDAKFRLFLSSCFLGLLVTIVSLTFAFGSFHIPFLWLWLGIIDARYCNITDQERLLKNNFPQVA